MKLKILITRALYLIILSSIILCASCTKESEPEPKPYTKVLTINSETLKQLLTNAGQAQMASLVNYSVDVYTYYYNMNYKGQAIEASGLICVPISSGGRFPVLSLQHGTITAQTEAPSKTYAQIQNMAIEGIAGLGYMVVIPDEIGFGSSSQFFHPFLVKIHQVSAVVEMLNAVKQIPDGDLSGSSASDSLFLLGYSQGAWVTMATTNELENNNHNWKLIASACGAGPYNTEQVMIYAMSQTTYPKPYYLAYGILSFLNEGLITNKLSDIYNQPYDALIPDLFDGTKTGGEIDAQLSTTNSVLCNNNFLSNYPKNEFADLQIAMQQNTTEAWLNKTPIMLAHGQNDVYIPKTISDTMYLDFLRLGSQHVDYLVIPATDHSTAAVPAIAASIIWFQSFKKQ